MQSRLAEDGIKKGSGPFGAVISKNGEIIAEANNRVVLSTIRQLMQRYLQ